jgi:hypothetical protein
MWASWVLSGLERAPLLLLLLLLEQGLFLLSAQQGLPCCACRCLWA